MDVYQLVYNQGRFPGDGSTEKYKLTQAEFDTLILAAASNGVGETTEFFRDVEYELEEAGFDTYSFCDARGIKTLIKLHNAIRLGKIFVSDHEEGVFAFCRKNQIKEASRKMADLERKIIGPDDFDF